MASLWRVAVSSRTGISKTAIPSGTAKKHSHLEPVLGTVCGSFRGSGGMVVATKTWFCLGQVFVIKRPDKARALVECVRAH